MKQTTWLWVALIAVAIIAIGGYVYPQVKEAVHSLGAAATCDGSQSTTCLDGNLKLNNGALQMSSSSLCFMFNATSTATPWKMQVSTLGATSTFNGTMYAQYGTCI